MAYDYEGAIAAGAKPEDIISYLAKQNNYDAQGAITAGAKPDDVLKYLSVNVNKPSAAKLVNSDVSTNSPYGVVGDAMSNFSTGFVKGGISTLKGIGTIGQTILDQTAGRVVNAVAGKGFVPTGADDTGTISDIYRQGTPEEIKAQEFVTPNSPAQSAGFVTEKISEFLIPSSKIAAVETGVGKLATGGLETLGTKIGVEGLGSGKIAGLTKAVTKSGIEGLASGGITAAQNGHIDDQVKTNAIVGGIFSLLGSTAGGLKNLTGDYTQKFGQKIQTTVIKPNAADLADGFKIENLQKYKLGGSNEQVLANTSNKLNSLSDELNQKLASSNTSINLNTIYEDTIKALGGGKAKNFGNIQGSERVLQALKGEIESVAGRNGLVSVSEAQLVKQGAGRKGAWVFGSGDPDASSVEKVYNTFYNQLKVAVEKSSPDGVKEINRQISDLIPIQNAVIRRLPVEARNSILSLGDHIDLFGALLSPKALLTLGAGRLAKSGQFGNFLVNVGEKVKSPSTSGIGQRILGQ